MNDFPLVGLNAITLSNLVPLPNVSYKCDSLDLDVVNSLKDLNLARKDENNVDSNFVFLIAKNNKRKPAKKADFYPICLVCKLQLFLRTSQDLVRLKFEPLTRYKLKDVYFDETGEFFKADLEPLVEPNFSEAEIDGVISKIIDLTKKQGGNIFNDFETFRREISEGMTRSALIYRLAERMTYPSLEDKYHILEANLLDAAYELLSNMNAQLAYAKLDQKIEANVKKAIDASQKEYYLREKMRAIQKELGDQFNIEEETDKYREKLKTLKMNDQVRERFKKEINRFSSMSFQSVENSILRNYLDFALDLPWGNLTKDSNDLRKVKLALDKNHYGLEQVKERILEYIAVKIKTKKNPQTIICFAGPPGVGKTSLAISIAEALGRKFVKQSLGGVRDESEIRGHRRTYVGAMPGRILKGITDAKTDNPVFLLDEIDKMASDYRGDPAAAMLEVLDPEQNKQFSDNFLEEPYDLSQVLFIATANDLGNVPGPLRDRMEIIELSSYTEYEKINIATQHLLPKQLAIHGLTDRELEITKDGIAAIIKYYTREAGVRQLDRLIAKICRKAVSEALINEDEQKVVVDESNLEKFLKKKIFQNNEQREKAEVGIVTGLAYTEFGGDTLDIEVTSYPGKGELLLTGKLGDVMKESARTAYSYVKANYKKYTDLDFDFDHTDIHIHVPEGAVPKDGPSAGVTLTTALISLITNKPVSEKIGMTGEITLRGKVLPIGGLKEKSISAVRTGLNRIFIPIDNEKDLDEVPSEVKAVLTITPVKTIDELLSQVFN